jgi:hypothetical protein
MARVILNTTSSYPNGRLEVLRDLYGADVIVAAAPGVNLREQAAANLQAAVGIAHSGDLTVVGIIVPQGCLGDIGVGDPTGMGIPILTEDFVRAEDGRVKAFGQDPGGRDIFQVSGYRRLVRAEMRIEPVAPGSVKAKSALIYVVSRHNPVGRQESLDAAYGENMVLAVEDIRFEGRPRAAIQAALEALNVDAVIVPKAILKDLRFGDAFGKEVAILVEEVERGKDGEHTSAGKEAGGSRDVFTVVSLSRFVRAEVITEPVVKSASS